MNLQELSALAQRLQKNEGGGGLSGLEALAQKIENTLVNNESGVFDANVVRDFTSSKDSQNRYKITGSEPAVIQNAKAMVNLLRTLDKIPPQILEAAIKSSAVLTNAFLNSESDFSVSSILQGVGLATLGLVNDVVQDPSKYAASMLTSPLVNTALNAAHAAISNPGEKINGIAGALWGNKAAIKGAVVAPKSTATRVMSDAGRAIDNAKDIIYRNVLNDINVYNHQVQQLAGTIKELASSADPAIKQMQALSNILVENDIYKLYDKASKGVIDKSEGTKASAESNVRGFTAKVAGTLVNPLSSGITELNAQQRLILASIKQISALANHKLADQHVKESHLNKASGLYNFNEQANLTGEQKQLMKVANISHDLGKLAEFIMRAQNDGVGLIKDREALKDCLRKIGSIWDEIQKIDPRIISDTLLDKGICEVYEMLLSPVKETIIATIETEIKMGLSKDTLLPDLEHASKMMNTFAKANRLPVISSHPFAEERKIAMARTIIEVENKQKKLNETNDFLKNNPIKEPGPILMQILKTIEKLKEVPTFSSAEYIKKLVEMRDEITGLKKLDTDIKKLESEIFILNEKVKNSDVGPLNEIFPLDMHVPIATDADKKSLAAKLDAVGSLHQQRDSLEEAINKVDQRKDNYVFRNNKYYTTNDCVFVSETVKPAQIAEINVIGKKVVEDISSLSDGNKINIDRQIRQMESLGGNFNQYAEKERARISSTVKVEEDKPSQGPVRAASTLDQNELNRIEKTTSRESAEQYRAGLTRNIAEIDRVGEEQFMQSKEKATMDRIILKAGGNYIDTFKEKRIQFMDSIKSVLSDQQRNLLSENTHVKNGLYLPDAKDTALLRGIKDVHNVMKKMENLLELYVKFNVISSAGYANPALLSLLAPLRDNINGLVADLKSTGNDLRILGAVAGNAAGQAVMDAFYDVVPLIDQIPELVSTVFKKYDTLSSTFDVQGLQSIGDLPKHNLQKALDMSKSMGEGIPSPEEIRAGAKAMPDLDIKAAIGGHISSIFQRANKAFYGVLEEAGIKPERNGMYNMGKINPDSIESDLAFLHNQGLVVREALDACSTMSEGRMMAGGMKLLSVALGSVVDYIKTYDKLISKKLENYSGAKNEVIAKLKAELTSMTPEIGKLLDGVQPIMRTLLSHADVMELTLGLKSGVLTEAFAAKLKSLDSLVSTFGSISPDNNDTKMKATLKAEQALANDQLAMLRGLAKDPTQNQSLLNNQIKQTEGAIAVITAKVAQLEKKERLRSVGVASSNIGNQGGEQSRREKERAAFNKPRVESVVAPSTNVQAKAATTAVNAEVAPAKEVTQEVTSQRKFGH